MSKRVEMIHSITGTRMFVPEEQVGDYLAAGHKRAAIGDPLVFDPATGETEKTKK